MRTDRNRDSGWPSWLRPLRPDDVARTRVRSRVMRRAAPILAARRGEGWGSVAAGWTRVLVPAAAAAILVFSWLALQAGPAGTEAAAEWALEPAPAESVTLDPLGSPLDDAPPAHLTSETEPGTDDVLQAVLTFRE